MNRIALSACFALFLTGCNQSDRFASSVMGGALIGGVIAEDNRMMGMMIGGALGGIISKAQMSDLSADVDYRYRSIIETGVVNQRYYLNNVYGEYDMAVYPGYGFQRMIQGYRYECRSMRVYVFDGPRVYERNLAYCRSSHGWFEI